MLLSFLFSIKISTTQLLLPSLRCLLPSTLTSYTSPRSFSKVGILDFVFTGARALPELLRSRLVKVEVSVVACTQEEVNKVIEMTKVAQKARAKTPFWKRAELLHKAATILKKHKAPIGECLVKEIAKPAKDSVAKVAINFY
ncbi:unnamed protein product [Fraxinus pennsylvanica]|uniref:NADP-dependent glyceraldehyde-3-phosphate dehydrogenase n=1 Tax=Fraxinus pennsylvanica TaxID=56036 RepID=A0AAD2ABM1_9LAMI|nr:unnamed protein product [Fraxinus pennsylvanica]